MNKQLQGVITVQNKKYTYTLYKKQGGIVHVVCKAANIDQDFLAEDVADLLIDLPNLIVAEKAHQDHQSSVVRFRISPEDKRAIEKKAVQRGFNSVSEYLRSLALSQ